MSGKTGVDRRCSLAFQGVRVRVMQKLPVLSKAHLSDFYTAEIQDHG